MRSPGYREYCAGSQARALRAGPDSVMVGPSLGSSRPRLRGVRANILATASFFFAGHGAIGTRFCRTLGETMDISTVRLGTVGRCHGQPPSPENLDGADPLPFLRLRRSDLFFMRVFRQRRRMAG